MEIIPTLAATEVVDTLLYDDDRSKGTVIFFESASYDLNENMEPMFVAGRFEPPQFVRGSALRWCLDGDFGFPPSAGVVEKVGRLKYIDGCSSSLLICPPRRGDPCVNHLHIIQGIDQTEHHHPSDRIGMVVRGEGIAAYQDASTGWFANKPLNSGIAWRIPAGTRHYFRTPDSSMDVLVLHPDSAWGPDDESHQMLDATII